MEETEEEKYNALRSLIAQKNCPTIVYVSRTRRTIQLAEKLTSDGFPAKPFNGKMDSNEKITNQEAFINNQVKIIVATSAFGMGVDKKDVKLVIHYDISDSLENYVQEAGRAGRDPSLLAECYVLFNDNDLDKHFIIGKRCLILKNESSDLIFKKEDRNYSYNNHANSIMETYLRQVYDGSDREDLLKSSKNELTLSKQAVEDFEAFLNNNIPSFDREMYESISVHADEQGHISIFLNEKTGEQINLNETSAGRRWYFTYYFMKNMLSKGDIFIIDEPAAMLHPSAQREVLRELIELTKRGIKVVYSTHSPYLIPEEWRCVHFVTMTKDGTKVNGISSNQELINQMADIIGEDIFDIQTVFDMYTQSDTTKIGRKCYNAIKNKGEKLEDAASKLLVSVDTIKSWNRNGNHFRCPKIENIIAVSKYTNIKIQDLLN